MYKIMPRPTTKAELISASATQFTKLWKLIDAMPETLRDAQFAFEDRDRNVRDVLAHLYEWHAMMLSWVDANQNGKPKPFLPAPYNWKTYPQLNIELWDKHQSTRYEDARSLLLQSHTHVMALLETFSDEALFEKKHFPWTGTSTLGSYFTSNTSSHYVWAMKKLKQHAK